MPALPDRELPVADRVALGALEGALLQARATDDGRPALAIVADAVAELGVVARPAPVAPLKLLDARDGWIARVRSAGRSHSTVSAYRIAIDDLHRWLEEQDQIEALFEERTIVAYLDDYRQSARPARNTFHRRFVLLRCYVRWFSRSERRPDPFADLTTPARSSEQRAWLTPAEFDRMLAAASNPPRRRPGLAERDRLVLLALLTTGWRRAELLAIDWRDLLLDEQSPVGLVRRGKGEKPRPQPLPPALVDVLRKHRTAHDPRPEEPVFCGLAGRRLQACILASIIRRCAKRAGIEKHVTAHTLRHTAATWLRQAGADSSLVAEFLGHSDLSTVGRYAHVASEELHEAAGLLTSRLEGGGLAIASGSET